MTTICNDVWSLVLNYCDNLTTSELSVTTRFLYSVINMNQMKKEWVLEEVQELVANDYFALAKRVIKNEWIDEYEVDNLCVQSAMSGNFKLLKLAFQNSQAISESRKKWIIKNACLLGHLEIVQFILKHVQIPYSDINDAFEYACSAGQVEIVKEMLKDPRVDIGYNNNKAIKGTIYSNIYFFGSRQSREQVQKNHCEILQILLDTKRIDNTFQENLFAVASHNCNHGAIEMLLKYEKFDPTLNNYAIFANANQYNTMTEDSLFDKRVDPSVCNNQFIIQSVENPKMMKYLLQDERVDFSIRGNEAFELACSRKCLECVELLINHPCIDPSHTNNAPIKTAYRSSIGSCSDVWRIIKLLMKHPRVNPFNRTLKTIKELENTNTDAYFESLLAL